MYENWIVDWQTSPSNSFVSLRMQGRKAGLYKVKSVMSKEMLLSHGAISFPVGTELDVEDVLGVVPGTPNHVQVVVNDQSGLRLAW